MHTPDSVEEYIASFAPEVSAKLTQLRQLIFEIAPEAEEKIAYGMPGYRCERVRFYFAGFAKHIGFYPGAACTHAFAERLSGYKTGKGSIQFPLKEELPLDLIRHIIVTRLTEGKKG